MSEPIVTVDIGGTHARFAVARVGDGRCLALGPVTTLATRDYTSFDTAWAAFAQAHGEPLPPGAAFSIAGSPRGDAITFTNNPWHIHRSQLADTLAIERHVLMNDFEAVGHAVAQVGDAAFDRLCGPDVPLPTVGTICVVGPGTGLGISHLWRDGDSYRVQPTEGGHEDFAPLDDVEDALLARLRLRFGRVSIERIVAGPAIVDIYENLAALRERAIAPRQDREIWSAGASGSDELAAAAIDRYCLSLGSIAGDLALAQGASAVVIAGGLGLRIKSILARSGFAGRFVAKGRYTDFMKTLPVKLITHPEPGLFGAATAFARHFP